VAAQEVARALIQVEAQEDPARVREHHHEGHQRPYRLADLDLAEVRPVDLALLAGQRLHAQVGLLRPLRTVPRDHMPEVIGAAAVAAFAAHVVETARRQTRVPVQSLEHEGQVRIDLTGALRPRLRHALLEQDPADDVVMDAELLGDRADLPLLDVVEPDDLGLEVATDHPALLVASRPTARTAAAAPEAEPDVRRVQCAAKVAGDVMGRRRHVGRHGV
jgi:hypothetical protein